MSTEANGRNILALGYWIMLDAMYRPLVQCNIARTRSSFIYCITFRAMKSFPITLPSAKTFDNIHLSFLESGKWRMTLTGKYVRLGKNTLIFVHVKVRFWNWLIDGVCASCTMIGMPFQFSCTNFWNHKKPKPNPCPWTLDIQTFTLPRWH